MVHNMLMLKRGEKRAEIIVEIRGPGMKYRDRVELPKEEVGRVFRELVEAVRGALQGK